MSRIEKLRGLIETVSHGSKADFAKRINRSPAQVHQWASGHRAIGDGGARIIEDALNLPRGYFDDKYTDRALAAPAKVAEPTAEYSTVVSFLPPADSAIQEVVGIMESVDATGRAMALAAVKVALAGYKPGKANRAS